VLNDFQILKNDDSVKRMQCQDKKKVSVT